MKGTWGCECDRIMWVSPQTFDFLVAAQQAKEQQ